MEVADQAQGQGAVQGSVVGRPHGVRAVDELQGPVRIATRQRLGRLAEQIVLGG